MTPSPVEVVNQHYQVIIQKDLQGICAKYVPEPGTYVFVEGPRFSTTGFEHIKKGWTDFCASALQLVDICWTEGPYWEEDAGMSWVAGVIRLDVRIGPKQFSTVFRASFVLQWYQGTWKIKHEHVSAPHPDPYGIGDWLKNS